MNQIVRPCAQLIREPEQFRGDQSWFYLAEAVFVARSLRWH